ncbi:MAG TPA: succinylglutamate desuccinylase/aspartoacylase family protein [Desulfosporosinus sp.]|nr:succinylglutamate desuccinylase/aspartoacylase family protein [Desulfosporosinus sp.]
MAEVWEMAGLKAAPGEKVQGMVKLTGVEQEIPLVLIHGREKGPQTMIFGGVHGCEYSSIDAAIQLAQVLKPQDVRGRVAVIPVVNIEAYAARSIYVHPVDKKNLNRNFPGKATGTETERLAYQLTQQVLRDCDYLIDLHGGDMNESLVPFILYYTTADLGLNERAQLFAKAFGIHYIVSSGTVGSAYAAAASSGKVAVLAEAGQQGILDPAMASLLVSGSLNALRSVGVLPGAVIEQTGLIELKDFIWTRSNYFGTWYPLISVGDEVKPGQKTGEVRDLMGNVLQEVFTELAGTVLFCVTSLAINSGEPLFAVGR